MSLRKLVTMRAALDDPDYFGTLLAGASWHAWRVLLIAIMGEELTAAERAVFEGLTGREREPLEPVEEFWGVIGRRGGKTRAMAVLGAYLAACVDHRDVLGPGERGVLPILAASTFQAGQAFNFVDIRLLQLIEELPGVGREGFDEFPLPLGIDGIKGQRALAAAGESGDYDELIAGDVDGDILEIVFLGPANSDRFTDHAYAVAFSCNQESR